MFKAIQGWIFEKTGTAINHTQLKDSEEFHYVIGLLIKLAEIDGDFSTDESAKIISLVRFEERVSIEQALKTFTEAAKKCEALEVRGLLKVVNQGLSLPQKFDLIEMLYLLMRADDVSGSSESKFVRKVVSELQVPEEIHARAYKQALEKRVAEKRRS